tara:strand:+ start:428 stop:1633 length:1206 start_codon:yes stop_codon:yes gene_type:complete
MVCILIDYNNIIDSRNLHNIKKFLQDLPKKHSIGIVFSIDEETLYKLESIENGDDKVHFLDSQSFIQSINGYSYIVYDKNSKLCEIFIIKGNMLEITVEQALQNLPNDITIMFLISIQQAQNKSFVEYLAHIGFGDPFISDSNLLDIESLHIRGIYVLKNNFIVEPKELMIDITYLLYQIALPFCKTQYRFSDRTIKILKKLSRIGSSWNSNGYISQKEMGGRFLSKIDNDLNITLEIDDQSIITGEEEGVNIVEGLYNFHSHPIEAYERNKVSLGWPSGQDYLGFLASFLSYNTILHVVISLEGIYVLNLSNFWFNNKENIELGEIKDFILSNYKLECKDKLSPDEYVSKVNQIRFSNKQLFKVKFIRWENIADMFRIEYPKTNENCIHNQNLFNFLQCF